MAMLSFCGIDVSKDRLDVVVQRVAIQNRFVLVVRAAAEAADQISYSQSDSGSRVGTLLYGRTQEIVGFAGTFADGFGGVCRSLLGLAVHVLEGALHLSCLALELSFYVAGRAAESFFHLAAKVFSVAGKAILVHEPVPSEIWNVNGRNGHRFRSALNATDD
jgi:hypothetical protein